MDPLLMTEVEAVGLRLRACVREALGLRFKGVERATGKGIAAELGIDGVTARRLIKMTAMPIGGDEVLTRSPGVKQLRAFTDAVRDEIPGPEFWALGDAINKFDRVIKRVGGKAELTKILRAGPTEAVATVRSGEVPVAADAWTLHGDGRLTDGDGARVGAFLMVNPLGDPKGAVEAVVGECEENGEQVLLIPSGWFDEEDPFARDPRLWSPTVQRDLMAFAEDLSSHLQPFPGVRVLIRPHSRHALSDLQRCLDAGRALAGVAQVGLALDAVALLEPSAMGRQADHLEKAVAVLGGHVGAVIIADARVDGLGESLVAAEVGEGEIELGVYEGALEALGEGAGGVPRIVQRVH